MHNMEVRGDSMHWKQEWLNIEAEIRHNMEVRGDSMH
jgi:hypothetical protein